MSSGRESRLDRLQDSVDNMQEQLSALLNRQRSRVRRVVPKAQESTLMNKIAKGSIVGGGVLAGTALLGGTGLLSLAGSGVGALWNTGLAGKVGVVGGGAALLGALGGQAEKWFGKKKER